MTNPPLVESFTWELLTGVPPPGEVTTASSLVPDSDGGVVGGCGAGGGGAGWFATITESDLLVSLFAAFLQVSV